MTWNTVLDLDGAATLLVGGERKRMVIPGDLTGCVSLVTDFQGARIGVENVSGQVTAYAQIIEKQLREEGVIDDLAEVMVHAVDRRGGFAAVFYTAIPEEVALKYRGWAQQYQDHLFVYPLAAALLKFAQKSGLKDGALVFAHDNQVTVLVLRAAQVAAADSLQYAGELGSESGRIAQRIWAMCLENPADAKPVSPQFLILQDAWQASPDVELLRGAIAELAGADGADVGLTRIEELSGFLADLPLSIGQASALDRGLYYCKEGVPWLAAVLAIYLLVSLATGLHWLSQRNALQASLHEQKSGQIEGVSEKLKSAIMDARQLDPDLKRIRKMLDAREQVRLIPTIPDLLADIRAAASDSVQVTMVGAVSGKEGGLISISFRGKSLGDSFEAERSFIRELESRGYKVVKRDVNSATEGNMFKLSIIRSR